MIETNKISQAELSRRLNVPEQRLRRAIKKGLVVPDEIAIGRLQLFRVDRLAEIASIFNRQQVIA